MTTPPFPTSPKTPYENKGMHVPCLHIIRQFAIAVCLIGNICSEWCMLYKIFIYSRMINDAHRHACIHTHTRTHTHTHKTHMQTYPHIHSHTHTHTQISCVYFFHHVATITFIILFVNQLH